jgi:hypothetical protein
MFPFRSLFPSFERPVPPPRYLNIRPEGRGIGRKIGALMAGCLAFGIALAQFDGAPPVEGAVPPAAALAAPAQVTAPSEATLATPAVGKPRKITQVACGQKASVRRDCADIRAAREAKLAPQLASATETSATALAPARPGAAAEQIARLGPETLPANTALAVEAMAAATPAAASLSASPPVRAAARQKTRKARVSADEPPVERLVHIYDQVAPDGRRVPVYRRNDGGYETGTVVGDEYRPSRRVTLEPLRGQRYFGLQ